MSAPPYIIHTTPSLAGLPGSDPTSIYYASLLQLVVPGRWSTQLGDWGRNGGDLPYITHYARVVRPRHLPSLPGWSDPDDDLSPSDQAEALMWRAYIEQNLTDLVNHTLYSLPPNYPAVVAPALMTHLGSLQAQYIPQRIRAIHASRLAHVGLWGLGGQNEGDAADEDRRRMDEAFVVAPGGTKVPRLSPGGGVGWGGWRSGREMEQRRRAWGAAQLRERARGVLDVLARRVGRGPYFFGSRPTTPDLLLFAHLTLLLTPTYPNPILPDLIRETYPVLVAHHDRLRSLLFPSWDRIPRVPPPSPVSWSETISRWVPWATSASRDEAGEEDADAGEGASRASGSGAFSGGRGGGKGKGNGKSAVERRFERGRWLWFAGTAVAMVAYLLASGVVKVELVREGDEEDEDEDENGDVDEGEDDGEDLEEISDDDDDDEDGEDDEDPLSKSGEMSSDKNDGGGSRSADTRLKDTGVTGDSAVSSAESLEGMDEAISAAAAEIRAGGPTSSSQSNASPPRQATS